MPRLSSISNTNFTGLGITRNMFKYVTTIANTNVESSRADDDFAARRFNVAASSSLIAVGAPLEDITAGTTTDNGKVYVYNLQGQLLGVLTNPNEVPLGQQGGELNDNFGSAVWFTDQYLVVLAGLEDRSTDTIESNVGRLYLYDVTDLGSNTPIASAESAGGAGGGPIFNNIIYGTGGSTQNVYTKISLPGFTTSNISTSLSRNGFSGSVAVSQTYVAVPVGGPSTQRSVEIYTRNTDTGVSFLSGPPGSSLNFAGGDNAIAQNSTLTAVGDYGAQPNGETGDLGGSVWLFNSATGAVTARIDNPSTSTFSGSDFFGSRVAMNDKWLAIGAPSEDVVINGSLRQGQVYVYKLSDFSLAYTLQTPTPDVGQFGHYIRFQGNLLLISERITEEVHVYILK